MPRSYPSLTLDDAKRMAQAGEAAARSIGVAYNIAVVDAGGHLLAFARQDRCRRSGDCGVSATDVTR
jgi:uncharacterized protein GlcG (DUF336 family)